MRRLVIVFVWAAALACLFLSLVVVDERSTRIALVVAYSVLQLAVIVLEERRRCRAG